MSIRAAPRRRIDLPNLTRGETTGLFLPPDRIRLHPPNGCGPLWLWRDRCEHCGASAVTEAERFPRE